MQPEKLPITHVPRHTGLSDELKAGVEALSGLSLDGVKVHYNSAKSEELNAEAYFYFGKS
ncbi:hypothetical protein [Prosthecobacter sp.]|uniref:hypothetical protein n=1 Tax=Prosthecobacter sp. TaxID=1965333 RepID=UPI0037847B62